MKKTFRLALLLTAAFYFFIPFYSFSGDQDVLISTITINELNVNARTTYDLQSLGSSHMIEMNPQNPLEMHACFMVSTDSAPTYTNRNIRYFYTSNGGTTWDYIGVVAQTRAGYPSLGMTNDSRAVIMANSTENGGAPRTYAFIDVFAGAGTWTTLDPGNANLVSPSYPVCVLTPSAPAKLFFTASGYYNECINLTAPGTFRGYTSIDSASQTTMSAIGYSSTGKVGIAYITTMQTNVPLGSVKFIESTDEGVTWSNPVNVWITNFNTDSLGALRGIDCSYIGDTANVVFEICKRTPEGSYNPRAISKIMFWSPVTNNGIPIIVDSAPGLNGSNPTNDVYTSVSRPVIGYSFYGSYSAYSLIAYSKARTDTSIVGNNYYDLYSIYSTNKGQAWLTPTQLTNNSGPLRDYRYVSLSSYNRNLTPYFYYNFCAQSDSIPGSSVNGSTQSLAKMVHIILKFTSPQYPGVIPINTEIPIEFSLRQNYPNPFNPVTQIEFSVPKTSNVKIKIYNPIGELISVIASDRFIPGTYKSDFDATELASGVYYYIMEYIEEKSGRQNSISKKMVLVK